ncbi:hypothetical protein HDU79_007924 [Rhizoclosmatium sp. JEL0117]|nr:hypothetical protein HDU79_007924 [Rhizoclosmatium sp. JEL0117]
MMTSGNGVTLLDLYNFHLASSPASPVSASFLTAMQGQTGGGIEGTSLGRSRGAGSLRTSDQQQQQQQQHHHRFAVPKKSNFLCCGATYPTFALLAQHYEAVHSGPATDSHTNTHSDAVENPAQGIAIPSAKSDGAGSSDAQNIVSLSDLLSFNDSSFFPPIQQPPQTANLNSAPLPDILRNPPILAAPPTVAAVKGKSQLSLGLSAAAKQPTPPPQSQPSPASTTGSSMSPELGPNSSIFRNVKSADAMFSAGSGGSHHSGQQDDIDAALSALLSSTKPVVSAVPPPLTTTANLAALPTLNAPNPAIGQAIAAGKSKRNLSSAAFSLGSYTAADLKKLRTDFNFSGIDLDWLMGDNQNVVGKGGPSLFGDSNVLDGSQVLSPQEEHKQNGQGMFQSMAIPSNLGELARPIEIDSLTPENYLRMLLEAHHLVAQAHSFLGARDYQAVAHDLIASGVRPQDLTNAQLAQIVTGIQQIDLETDQHQQQQEQHQQQLQHNQQNQFVSAAVNMFQQQQQQVQQQAQQLLYQQQHLQQQLLNQQQMRHTTPFMSPALTHAPTPAPILDAPTPAHAAAAPVPAAPAPPAKIYTCPHCDKKYKSHSGFKYHLEHQHAEIAHPLNTIPRPPFLQYAQQQPFFGNQPSDSNGLAFAKQTPQAPAVVLVDAEANPLFGVDGQMKKQIHPSQLNKQFKCSVPGCIKSYKNKGGLKYHMEHDHAE